MDEPRRSIQDLIPPARSKPVRPLTPPASSVPNTLPTSLPPNPRVRQGVGLGPLVGIAVGVIIVLGIAFGIVSTVFHRATATVTVLFTRVPVSESFVASPTGANLAFAIKTVEESLSTTVESTGTEQVSERASGVLTVSNAFSSASQRLVTNTRFETADGRIFRIKVPLTVPGSTTKNGTVVPGTIEATVYADAPGDSYNLSSPTEFTLPGLKDSPQFTKITARSKGPMMGGFVGEKAIVSDMVRVEAVQDLSKKLEDIVRTTLTAATHIDDVVVADSVTITFTIEPEKPTADGATVTVRATASAPVFSMTALANLIAAEGSIEASGPLTISNIRDLSPTVTPSKTAGNLTLTLSGTAELKGSYDLSALKERLVGKNRKDVGEVLAAYPAIQDMQISVYPFWATTLPSDPGKITIYESLNATP